MPADFAWSGSLYREGELRTEACRRSLVVALDTLAGTQENYLDDAHLRKIAPRLGQAVRPVFSRSEETFNPFNVGYAAHGTLNSNAQRELPRMMGNRWSTVLDSRKFSVHVLLLEASSVEGRRFCLAEAGLTALAPDSMKTRVARQPFGAVRVLPAGSNPDVSACQLDLLESAATMLRDSYQDDLEDFARFQAEPGMTYPSAKELKASLARYDSAQGKAQRTVSTARSSNIVRCSNQCTNGNCLRTFEDGRQERWQAPRVYNPSAQNWEWDISTNACGG